MASCSIDAVRLPTPSRSRADSGVETPSAHHISAGEYYATQPPPSTLEADMQKIRQFIGRHKEAGRKVVLITSGGTTVPLERNVVRFLDNFSAGTRGATSAEYFLKAGYAVIFMHRQFSLQPFSRHYSHSTNPFLDFLELEPAHHSSAPSSPLNASEMTNADPLITVRSPDPAKLRSVLAAYKDVKSRGTLHFVTFVTVNEYLWLLRAVAKEMNILGRNAMYYLAAAVSDFFLPLDKMSEHKIQSGKGSLVLEMDQVPKILKPMVDEWTPHGFLISFKLETDSELLIPKARAALDRYGHQVVIGNELHRRKLEVVFVSHTKASEKATEKWLRIDEEAVNRGKEIEEDIIAELVREHATWIADGPS
ncbi:phosphopantothenate-cysteine ligase [Schizopora paradoxa]|uniref:Phosphopantothenate-cysteine ligase n=1 Tax=Schizopora paradoxa TaxID=27342 RepID=A0A0H2RY00_9AGAM|nr:phosphopantothenate-cysteine ligase [Schizopora paradoxa]